jgi:hypothetical protein
MRQGHQIAKERTGGGGVTGLKTLFVSVCGNLQRIVIMTFLPAFTDALMQMPSKFPGVVQVNKKVPCLSLQCVYCK